MTDSAKLEERSEPNRTWTTMPKTGIFVKCLRWLGIAFGMALGGGIGLFFGTMWFVAVMDCMGDSLRMLLMGSLFLKLSFLLAFLFLLVVGVGPMVLCVAAGMKVGQILSRKIVWKLTGFSRPSAVSSMVRTWTTTDGETLEARWDRTSDTNPDVIRLIRNDQMCEMDLQSLSEQDLRYVQQARQTGSLLRKVSLTPAQKKKQRLGRCLRWLVDTCCGTLGGILGFFAALMLIGGITVILWNVSRPDGVWGFCNAMFSLGVYIVGIAFGVKTGRALGRKIHRKLTRVNPDMASGTARTWTTTDGETLEACWGRTDESRPDVIRLVRGDEVFETDLRNLSEQDRLYLQQEAEHHKVLSTEAQKANQILALRRYWVGWGIGALVVVYLLGVAVQQVQLANERASFKEDVRKFTVPQDTPAGTRQVITVDGVEYAFRWCPPGKFLMGNSESGDSSLDSQHEVTLTKGFWMLETEVTQAMWRDVLDNSPSKSVGDDLPMENVGWAGGREFCHKLSCRTGLKVTLPTEAQWEYACRAGTTTPYAGDLDEMAWYFANSDGKAHPVAQKKPNAWGLYDMHGNVFEWCQDWADNYPPGSATDPTGAPHRTSLGYIFRGGDWGSYPERCRSDHRDCSSLCGEDVWGFRIAIQSE